MTNSKKTFTLSNFYEAIEEKDVSELCEMIHSGALYHIEDNESISVLQKLFSLKDMKLVAEITKHINFIPVDVILDLNPLSIRNKVFLNDLLTKYIGKFNYNDPGEAGRLFDIACKVQCLSALRFLLNKGVGESDYPRLISSSVKVVALIPEVKVKALDKDTISTFFMEAALSDYPEDRIMTLIKNGFNIRIINSAGLNVCEAFRKGIDNYNYTDDKKGVTEKSRDESSYMILKEIYDEYASMS